ncbi:MAG: hypothetical protein MRERC_4c073 [Mycoplasmataceae bacterium RC_NB112A]|nr:MAG: hypothetical protein MRERC_4c073 [Mycoplasmataceae bacterium RC_NB112A]
MSLDFPLLVVYLKKRDLLFPLIFKEVINEIKNSENLG